MYKKYRLRYITSFNGKDPHPYQTVRSGSISDWTAGSGSGSKWKAGSGCTGTSTVGKLRHRYFEWQELWTVKALSIGASRVEPLHRKNLTSWIFSPNPRKGLVLLCARAGWRYSKLTENYSLLIEINTFQYLIQQSNDTIIPSSSSVTDETRSSCCLLLCLCLVRSADRAKLRHILRHNK
jgi:hypothetical protein